jgi:hypothetical protein
MKKLFAFLAFALLATITLVAQDTIPVPGDVYDIVTNMNQYFGSLAGIAVVAAFFAAMLNGLMKVEKNIIKQLVAWAVAIALMVVTDLLNFGFAADFSILKAVIYGIGAGLVANGVFDIPIVKSILDKVEGWFKPRVNG